MLFNNRVFKRFYSFRESRREGEREGEEHQCERETQVGCLSHTPKPGTRPATQACALIGNRTSDLLLCEMTPNQMSHAGQSSIIGFYLEIFLVTHSMSMDENLAHSF